MLSDATASFGVGVGGLVSRDARGAGRRAVADAIAPLPPLTGDRRRTFIVFADTVLGNAAEVLRGGVQEAGAGGLWVGGGAGDNLGHVRTAQLGLGRAWHDRVVVVAIDAPLAFGVGIQHGWRPYGPPAMITRAHDDVAVELEDEPAFEVYRKTAAIRGDEVDEELFREFATTHPLGIPQASGEHVIRDPLALSPDGGLRCVGEVPDRAIVRVMQGERLDLVRAAHTAATAARAGVEGSPGGGIVFDCVSRRRVLGDAVSDELRAIQVGLGSGVPLMGCLTFGENRWERSNASPIPQQDRRRARTAAERGGGVTIEEAERELAEDRLARVSILQELSVAALELFDPERSPDAVSRAPRRAHRLLRHAPHRDGSGLGQIVARGRERARCVRTHPRDAAGPRQGAGRGAR